MKGLLLTCITFLYCLSLAGQKPETFSYQSIIRDFSGNVVVLKSVDFRFSILKGNPSGKVVYSEIQSDTTDKDGLVNLTIGNGTEKTGSFSSIEWNSDTYFLKIEADPSGGFHFYELSTTQLLNVPYESEQKQTKRSASLLKENEFLITRKFVGSFLDYRHTGKDSYTGLNLIWIKTSLESTFGKISAFGKECDFSVGDNLYIRRIYYSPGDVSGYWVYQIENDSSLFYKISEFQYDRKVFVETWF